jgi:hypothetical protein
MLRRTIGDEASILRKSGDEKIDIIIEAGVEKMRGG